MSGGRPGTHPAAPGAGGLLPAVRVMLATFCVLTAAGFVSLFALADRTPQTFAWTINPPVTAAFLGAGYGAGFVLSVLSLRAGGWPEVRVPYLTVLAFTWLTTVATFVHVDRMHFAAPGQGPVAEPAAWFWTAVYVVVPVGMALLLVPQERAPRPAGAAPAVTVPRALTAALAVEGAVLGLVGAALFLAPTSAQEIWPWPLTPLTARVVAAWLLAFAVAAALSQRVADLRRLRTGAIAYTVFGGLQLATVARYAGDVRWGDPVAWGYVGLLLAVTVTGAAGWLRVARATGRLSGD